MNPLVRPQPRLAAALLAAGVVTASSVVNLPAPRDVPTVTAHIAYASAVTDALVDAGQGVEVVNSLVGIHVDAVISLPFEATLALLAAVRNPELSPSVLSFLVQRFVNPAVGEPIHAYPYDTELTVARLAALLPYPLGPSATEPGLLLEGGRIFAEAFDSVLGQLPDPIPACEAVGDVMNDTVLGGLVVAAHLTARAPMNMVWNTANYLGYLPANVEAVVESALADPAQLPGLVSHLAYGLLSPDPSVGLVSKLLDNAVDPATWLPAPVGFASDTAPGLANLTRDGIADAVNSFLSRLPAPVTPSALPPSTGPVLGPRGGSAAGKGDENVSVATISTPEATPEVARGDQPEAAKNERADVEPAKSEPTKAKPTKTEPTKAKPKVFKPFKPLKFKPFKLKFGPRDEPAKAEPESTAPSEPNDSADSAA